MRIRKATQSRLLALVLLLGFTALTLHVSMHAQPDPQGCELCGGHVNPTHAVAVVPQISIEISTPDFDAWLVPQSHRPEPLTAYRQRAPPVLG